MARDYRFVNKNPKIDIYRTAMQDRGISINQLSHASSVSVQTIHNHLYGNTKNPQTWTLILIYEALGIGEYAFYLDTGRAVMHKEYKPFSKSLLKAWGVTRAQQDRPKGYKLTPPKKRKSKLRTVDDNVVDFNKVNAA